MVFSPRELETWGFCFQSCHLNVESFKVAGTASSKRPLKSSRAGGKKVSTPEQACAILSRALVDFLFAVQNGTSRLLQSS